MPTPVVSITFNRLPAIISQLGEAAGDICEDTARNIEARIKIGMGEPKHGVLRGAHQASAPGEMPAVDQQNLIAGIDSKRVNDGLSIVSSSAEYGVHLEYGAPAAGILPRPFMLPAAEAERDAFVDAFRDLESRL